MLLGTVVGAVVARPASIRIVGENGFALAVVIVV